jgi:hypothetical protein
MNGSNLVSASSYRLCRERGGATVSRRTNRSLAGFTLMLFITACSTVRADEFSQNSHYSVRLFSVGSLTIDTRVGDIDITGWDEPRVEIDAEKVVRAKNHAGAQPLFDQIRVVLEGQDKQVRLRTLYPSRRLWRPFRDESKLTVNFAIKMPYDAALNVACVDGDVRVSGVTGREQLRVNYGDVEVDLPSVWALHSFYARTWLGYIENDLHGTDQDGAGLHQKVSFWNPDGKQDVAVRVRMGGVFVYSNPQ